MQKEKLNILTDEQLVQMAKEGSLTAEEFIISKYKEDIKKKAHLYYIVGGDRDDVIQEGMIGIFKAIKSFDESKEASFRTHMEQCVRGQIFNAIKKANRLKHQPLNQSISIDGDDEEVGTINIEQLLSPKGQTDPEARLLLKEFLTFLREDKEKLFSEAESQVVDLMIEGESTKEIARTLGKSNKSVDNTVQRIKKKIANRFDKDFLI